MTTLEQEYEEARDEYLARKMFNALFGTISHIDRDSMLDTNAWEHLESGVLYFKRGGVDLSYLSAELAPELAHSILDALEDENAM